MGKRYLIDTNPIIDFLGELLPANGRKFMQDISPVISVITEIELLSGKNISPSGQLKINSFLKTPFVYNILDTDIVQRTVAIRKQHNIKLPDAIIAATALVNGLDLITHNTSDFKNIPGLKVIDPWNLPRWII